MAIIGGYYAIVCFHTADALLGFIENDWMLLNDILQEFRPFNPNFIPDECFRLTIFRGIPPYYLEEKIIKFLASQIGSLLSLEFDFDKP